VVSDDHEGLKKAIAECLSGIAWQRCYVHFLRNAIDHLPRKRDDDCLVPDGAQGARSPRRRVQPFEIARIEHNAGGVAVAPLNAHGAGVAQHASHSFITIISGGAGPVKAGEREGIAVPTVSSSSV
jgi:hypothetical protein